MGDRPAVDLPFTLCVGTNLRSATSFSEFLHNNTDAVLLKDLVKKGCRAASLCTNWTLRYFAGVLTDDSLPFEIVDNLGVVVSHKSIPYTQFLATCGSESGLEGHDPNLSLYLRNLDPSLYPSLVPEIKPIADWCQACCPSGSLSQSVMIGHRGTTSRLHHDRLPVIICVLTGLKRVVLVPPSASNSSTTTSSSFSSTITGCDDVDWMNRFLSSDYASAAAMTAERTPPAYCSVFLSAGDGLHIPPNWLHFVQNMADTVSLSTWIRPTNYVEGSEIEAVVPLARTREVPPPSPQEGLLALPSIVMRHIARHLADCRHHRYLLLLSATCVQLWRGFSRGVVWHDLFAECFGTADADLLPKAGAVDYKVEYFLWRQRAFQERYPKKAIAWWISHGFLRSDSDEELASLLFREPRLGYMAGDILASCSCQSRANRLKCYLQFFNFSGLRLVPALTLLLAKIRLPGEAPKIDPIMEAFANEYSAQNQPLLEQHVAEFPNINDGLFVLVFAVIMLSTDLEQRRVRAMSREDFLRNVRDVTPVTLAIEAFEDVVSGAFKFAPPQHH